MAKQEKKFTEDDFVNQADLARFLNCSKPYITKLVKKGVLVFKDRKIQIKEAIKKINENTIPDKINQEKKDKVEKLIVEENKNESEIDNINIIDLNIEEFYNSIKDLSLIDSKAKAEHLDLIKAKIQIDKETEKLISVDDVKNDAFNIANSLNKNLLTIPANISDQLADIKDPKVIFKILETEIRSKLDDVIEELEKIINA